MVITCKFDTGIYRNPSNGYTVAVYSSREAGKVPKAAIRSEQGSKILFTAVGNGLPCYDGLECEMEGEWKDSERYGRQFSVHWFHMILPKEKEGMIAYLSSDLMDGVGPVTARKMVDLYGEDTFRILEEEPEKLLSIRGITKEKLDRMLHSYRESTSLRDLMTFLAPFKVTPKKAEKIRDHFGEDAARIVKEEPYRLCEVKGFGFLTVDPIARASRGFEPSDPLRIKTGISYILKEAEKQGHLYLENKEVISQAEKLLNQGFAPGTVPKSAIIRTGNEMVIKDQILQADVLLSSKAQADHAHAAIYLKSNRQDEQSAVKDIFRILTAQIPVYDIEQELEEAQAELGILLAEKQKEAVRMVFRSPFSIITGGPGKGKTTNLKVILRVFDLVEKRKEELLCAPTGRARKRLSESTGYPALTIHKALYLTEEELEEDEEFLEEDFVIADEFTMADMHLAKVFFSRIKTGARVVLVGDVDQLPSVGPGNVFKELIESGVIPVTVLDVFFRQAKDSRIILNADRMNRGQKDLLFGEDFQFHYAETPKECADKILDIYLKELASYGNDPDMVQVLSPFKQKTEAGVNSLNRMLREAANPSDLRKAEWNTENGMFRQGDKLMQTKNTDVISNGDIGRLTIIGRKKDGTRTITVDFGDTKKEYEEEELDILELAYATSIHKSQGAEFPVVILPVLSCFYPMLKRNVYYTGVTRARTRVHLVGTKKALAIAISQNDAGKRNTLLALRLRQEAVRRGMSEHRKAA